jgi:hypothetical protein
MSTHAYCTKQDALDWLGGGAIRSEARLLAAVDVGSNTLTLDSHALATGRPLRFRVEDGGSIMDPLAVAVEYYSIELTDSTFQVSATPGGPAIDITTAGDRVSVIRVVPWQEYILDESAKIDEDFIGNAPVGDGDVPRIIKHYASGMVIERALVFSGAGVDEALEKRLQRIHDDYERYRAGKPLRAPEKPPATNTAASGPRLSASAADARGWRRHCGSAEVIP